MNTQTHRLHTDFITPLFREELRRDNGRLRENSISTLSNAAMRGDIVYHPNAVAPDGSLGVYRFEVQPSDTYSFERVAYANEVLAASMPFLENNLAYHPAVAGAGALPQAEGAL
ncbi:hypothetical protein [Candidatus Poriferisodalis sp.]|uniref:hypothetical protein n=1 Tax=Candidatus Poriferisodalis sp. TaxID=3101277 RepID=UPI003B01A1C3